MSLNWKEINLILEELDLPGSQIQNAIQSAYDIVVLRVHKKGETKNILVSLSPLSCRINQTFSASVKADKPLRFAQFLNSRIVNGWIEEASQAGDDRIVKISVRRGESRYFLYIRLWSNAANFIVTDENGTILDAMKRLPKRGEVTGGTFPPETASPEKAHNKKKEFFIRELPGEGSFNKKIDEHYANQGGALSLESLREQARRNCEGSMGRINAALERLKAKEAEFEGAEKLKNYGDVILSNLFKIKNGDSWLEAEGLRIELDSGKSPNEQAAVYYEKYKKAKSGYAEIKKEIAAMESELSEVEKRLERLLTENNPLMLAKLLKTGAKAQPAKQTKRPGLNFRRGDWQIIVGRDSSENDELLRRHVKGNDLWLHARDYHGAYVFIKQRAGKTVPLDILLDAGNLAIFYSKGRNNAQGDLFYTQVKYLRRTKQKGLVIPTQEKNLNVKTDENRLRELESCRVYN